MAGKYERRRKTSKFCRFFYILNIVMLILAAVKVFGSGEEPLPISGASNVLTQALASMEPDVTAPELHGVQDILVYAGQSVAYRSSVSATDDRDENATVEVDASLVDLGTPGSYTVTYWAEDAAGNRSCAAATVTVLPAQENFVDLETVMAAVDRELEAVVTDNMSLSQQVRAVYDWAHERLTYQGHTNRADVYQAAYEMLTTKTGDCYGYFAVSKLMLERLGIPTIDVEKVKNHEGDSSHYWSLVSIDGGQSFYHFDCTPRLGKPFDFCLITDEALDAYSAEHKFSHNRDTSLYPATPEE